MSTKKNFYSESTENTQRSFNEWRKQNFLKYFCRISDKKKYLSGLVCSDYGELESNARAVGEAIKMEEFYETMLGQISRSNWVAAKRFVLLDCKLHDWNVKLMTIVCETND